MIITAFYRRVGRSESPKNAGVLGSNLDWRTKTTETRPDGTERIVFSNARTQPMLEVIRTTEGGISKQQGTYTRYNARGQAIYKNRKSNRKTGKYREKNIGKGQA